MSEIEIPKRIFIIPYRNRLEHKFFFCNQMTFILEGQDDYQILFVHQDDKRNFNRGAIKNIGFLAIKEKYPDNYKEITFIFNDVDTLPFHRIFDYETIPGVVRHYYGFENALGGIVVIKGVDFEKLNGYPNFWGWGMEDACLQKRCYKYNIKIDRSQFYPIGSPEILQLFDGVSRLLSKKDYSRMIQDNGYDGLKTIHKLIYTFDEDSSNCKDNEYVVINKNISFINVTGFLTSVHFDNDEYFEYDLREPKSKIVSPYTQVTDKKVVTTDDWKNISYYPTMEERRILPQQMQEQRRLNNVNIFSQEYARMLGEKPRATKSVNIGLGGVKYR